MRSTLLVPLAALLAWPLVSCDSPGGGAGGVPCSLNPSQPFCGGGDVVTGGDTVTTGGDTTATGGDTATPPQDTAAPPADTVAPPEDTVAPPEDTVAPPADTGPPADTQTGPCSDGQTRCAGNAVEACLGGGWDTIVVCPGGQVCAGGQCVPGCTPQCEGKECGPDGCGGSCGTCPAAAPLCASGTCKLSCQPDCGDRECGDDGCGGSCGTCPAAAPVCQAGFCACQPQCSGKQCGFDGCGGSCGTCFDGFTCEPVGGTCEPPGEGACANDGDLTILEATDIFTVAGNCALPCLSDEDPECSASCIAGQTGLSVGCSGCFGNILDCILASCLQECVPDPSGVACTACRGELCDPAFEACAGIPASL